MVKYYSRSWDGEFRTHESEDKARESAHSEIPTLHDESSGEWWDGVENVSWGVIKETATISEDFSSWEMKKPIADGKVGE